MEIYFESMSKIHHRSHTIRCWRKEETYDKTTKQRNLKDIKLVLKSLPRNSSQLVVANELILIENMNAVEVLDDAGFGPVIYKDWP